MEVPPFEVLSVVVVVEVFAVGFTSSDFLQPTATMATKNMAITNLINSFK